MNERESGRERVRKRGVIDDSGVRLSFLNMLVMLYTIVAWQDEMRGQCVRERETEVEIDGCIIIIIH